MLDAARPAIRLDAPLTWQEVAAVADGAPLTLSPAAWDRIAGARAIVEAIMAKGIRTYGLNTGVGALADTLVPPERQRQLSRNLVMSHACAHGEALPARAVRAIVAAQINNHAHGHSGVRPAVVAAMAALLARDVVPDVPARGSIGYLTHMAHIALALIGDGAATRGGVRLEGPAVPAALGIAPLVLEAKEGLSLINGTPCATGLAAVALARASRLLDWADAIAALSFEALGGEPAAFDAAALALRRSPGLETVGTRLRALLAGSPHLAGDRRRTQDALSLRAVPHVHGAARDVVDDVGRMVDRELASVTDNPAVAGTPDAPVVMSEAHAVGVALGFALDGLAVALASVAAMAERRLDRMLNPMVSGLPAFLAAEGGVCSGLMIAQYTAVSLVAENRRLAAPASLDGGITSALQEDHLCHPTPAALKALAILDNAETILAIEWLAAGLAGEGIARAPGTAAIQCQLRAVIAPYADDRPLAADIAQARRLIADAVPGAFP